MSIKSILLGSAAAMVAVSSTGISSTQAADAVVVEPEPVEYVRICDAYGTGFFYIPGTETCIRFSGYVRSSSEKTYVDRDLVGLTVIGLPLDPGGPVPAFPTLFGEFEHTFWGQRARLNIDVRNETDWGTLRSQFRLEGGDSNIDTDIDMDRALISLAGFRFGFTDSYWATNHGYAGVNLTGLGAALTYTTDDGWYGFNDATIFDYTFAADGFSVTVGVEDPRIDWSGLQAGGSTALLANAFAPRVPVGGATFGGGAGAETYANFYAGFNWSQDWGTLAVTAVHDSQAIEFGVGGPFVESRGAWAYAVSLSLDLSEWIPGGILHGKYMWDGDAVTNYVTAYGALYDPESIFQISFQADLSDEVQLVAQYSQAQGSELLQNALTGGAAAGAPINEDDAFNASVGLNWFPAAAPGFSIRGSYKWGEANNAVRLGTNLLAANFNEEWHGFFIGVRRDF